MNNTTTYVNFSSIDYKGQNSLSSYALDITPLIFIPDASESYHHRVVWDFGDGTTSKSFSTLKTYNFPGKYNVNLIVYDCNNNAMISTFEKTITILDYTPFTFKLEAFGYVVTEDGLFIVSEDGSYIFNEIEDNILLKCGKIDGPFTVTSYFPPYQTVSNIYYHISGSNSADYWDIVDNKFNHLENFHTFYDKMYNFSLSSYQYREIDKIEPILTKMYAKIDDGVIVSCLSSDDNSTYVGMVGTKDVYLKEDCITNLLVSKFWFDKTNNKISLYENPDVDYLNNLGITLSANVINNTPTRLSITSNGLDGEGFSIESFKIHPIKYFNTSIPFVIKIKDVDNMSVKNFNPIALSALTLTLSSIGDTQLVTEDGEVLLNEYGEEIYATGVQSTLSSNVYTISSLNYTLSSQNSGGAFRGYITFPYIEDVELLQNVNITATGTFINDQLSSYTLEGSSNYFNVYSQNYFDLYKKNEDFNPQQTLLDLTFQESMLEKPVLFEDFLGGLLGNADSTHESIGIKIYEKIANFVQNIQDLDSCEQTCINSLGEFVAYNDSGEENYQYPEKIKRLVDLASLDKHKLIGELNKFKENFDIKGRSSKTEYGVNIGEKVDPMTYVVEPPTSLVALEKFSNTYVLLNTFQPVSAVGSHTYPLSSYTSDWGWPLVLPTTFDFEDIEKYYLFFDYVDQTDNTAIGGIVDFINTKTTVESTSNNIDLFGENGIFDNMFLDTLYQSLSLVG